MNGSAHREQLVLLALAAMAALAQSPAQAAAALVQEAAAAFSRAALGEEGVEGTMAFLQKRKPRWVAQ